MIFLFYEESTNDETSVYIDVTGHCIIFNIYGPTYKEHEEKRRKDIKRHRDNFMTDTTLFFSLPLS